MATLRDKMEVILKAMGCKAVESRSSRFIVLTHPERQGVFYFLGKAGALRVGKSATASTPVSDNRKAALVAAYDNFALTGRFNSQGMEQEENV